jgi:Anti-sigma factor NepR
LISSTLQTTGRRDVTAQNETPTLPTADLIDDPIVLGLKRLYDSVLEEAVPDDFMDLLGQIDAELAQHKDDTAPKDPDELGISTSGQRS